MKLTILIVILGTVGLVGSAFAYSGADFIKAECDLKDVWGGWSSLHAWCALLDSQEKIIIQNDKLIEQNDEIIRLQKQTNCLLLWDYLQGGHSTFDQKKENCYPEYNISSTYGQSQLGGIEIIEQTSTWNKDE